MNDKVFDLEIITPRRVVFKGKVISFTAPGVLGGFQVLYNHAPFLSALEIGEVKIVEHQGKEIRYAISGGFTEVIKNKATILADTADRMDEIDIPRAEAAKDRARQRLRARNKDIDVERASLAYRRAQNRLKVAGKK